MRGKQIKVALATFAEAANFSSRPRVNILGAFSTISPAEHPYTLPPSVYLFRLVVMNSEPQAVVLRLTILSPEGEAIFEQEQDFEHGAVPAGAVLVVENLVPLFGLVLPISGVYRAVIAADGETLAESELYAPESELD